MSPCRDVSRLSVLLSTVITFLFAPGSSDAATYFASGEGGSDYTLPEAMALAGPGDTVQLADGTYRERLETVTNGRRDRPITIVGGEGAILKPTSPAVLIKHSHIHLLGFSVDGLTGPAGNETSYINKCVWVEGDEGVEVTPIDGFEMRNMFIQNCGTECVRLKNFVTGASISDNTIQNCGIWDYQFARGEKNGEGIYIGTSSKQWTYGEDRCNSNYISGNTITTNGNECVDIKEGSTENVIESNYCSHQLDEYSGCFSSRSDANTFRNNQASDCKGAGIRLGGWLVDGYQYGQTNNVYNNDVADAAVGFIKIETMSQGLICGNTCEDGACEVTGGNVDIGPMSPFETCSSNDLQNAIEAEPFSEDSSLPVASTPSSDDSTTEESTSSSDNDSTAEESTSSSTDDSTTEESTSSSDEESTTEESTSSSSDDSTTEESTSSSYDDSTTEESTSSSDDDSTTEEPTSSSDDDSTTEESTSSSYDDSTTEESTPSSDDDSTAEESTSSSTDDSTTEESTSSSDDDSTTEESTSSSDEESTTEESTSSSSDDSTTEESTSSSYDDSTTEESTSSSDDDSTTEEPTSSSDDDSTTEESTSSSYDDSTTEESTSSSNDDSTTDDSSSSSYSSSSPSPILSSPSSATSFPTSSPSFSPTSSPSWSPTWSPTSFPTYSLSPSPTESGGDGDDEDDDGNDDDGDDDDNND